jgi:GH3 auxin-responsive promoter
VRHHAFYRSIARSAARFRSLLPQASQIQHARLRSILARNAGTEFGRAHGFDQISSPQAYRERVLVRTYEDFAPYIERLASGETNVLTREAVIAFEETAGSTSGPKLIPMTAPLLESFGCALRAWLDDLAIAFPPIAQGRAYWSISPAARSARSTPSGIPIGLGGDAAYFGELAALVAATLAVSPDTAHSSSIEQWRESTCRQLENCADLSLISVWSPTFLLELLDQVDLRRKPLAVISCWDQAASRPWAQALSQRLPGVKIQGKGLLATEGVVSIPLAGLDWPVLAVDSGYYEFLDDDGKAFEASSLNPGQEYAVLMSTEGGLYRYAIGDRVRMHGFVGEAPLLEFCGRGACASDLCGEKLTEAFVVKALAPLGQNFLLLAPACGTRPQYELFCDAHRVPSAQLDALAAQADRLLQANPQYAYARSLGQIEAVRARRVVRPLQTWIAHNSTRGQRLGEIKAPVLSADPHWAQRFQYP